MAEQITLDTLDSKELEAHFQQYHKHYIGKVQQIATTITKETINFSRNYKQNFEKYVSMFFLDHFINEFSKVTSVFDIAGDGLELILESIEQNKTSGMCLCVFFNNLINFKLINLFVCF